MEYRAVCFDIVNTPISQFERLESVIHASPSFLKSIAAKTSSELVALLTCNRCEFYLADPGITLPAAAKTTPSKNASADEAIRSSVMTLFLMLAEACDCSVVQLQAWASVYENGEVVQHLLETTAGLQSIAVGETQIQGQVKDAYLAAHNSGLAGKNLTALFEAALHAGKRARTETGLEKARISLGNLAIRSLQQDGAFADAISVVIIGTGKMAKNAAEYFLRNGISRDIVFLTYHPEKRSDQLSCFNAKVRHIDTLADHLIDTDLIFSAYGTEQIFLTREQLQNVIGRRSKPLYLIDIGMPHDIDPAAVELPGVRLIDFFELKKIKESHPVLKSKEIAAAEQIIAQEIESYFQEQKLRKASSTISHFRSRAEVLRQKELERVFNKLAHLQPEDREAIQKLTYNLVNKILNPPTVKIRQRTLAGQLDAQDFQLINDIFS